MAVFESLDTSGQLEDSPSAIFARRVVDAFSELQRLCDERIGLQDRDEQLENGAMQLLWADRIQQLDTAFVRDELDGQVTAWDVALNMCLLDAAGLSERHDAAIALFDGMPKAETASLLL